MLFVHFIQQCFGVFPAPNLVKTMFWVRTYRFDGSLIKHQCEEGFEETHSLATIFKRNNQNNKRLINAFVPNNIKKQSVQSNDKSIFKNKSQLVWEIDVHIENIVEHFYHLSNYEIINLQLEVCEEMILKAQRMKIRKLIIIHGKGQGVLRNEIHQMLYSFNLDFKDAGN